MLLGGASYIKSVNSGIKFCKKEPIDIAINKKMKNLYSFRHKKLQVPDKVNVVVEISINKVDFS